MAEPFFAVAIQPEVRAHYYTGKPAKEQKKENIDRFLKLIDRFVSESMEWTRCTMPKLLVFPESFIHGFGPAGTRDWKMMEEISIRIPGEEVEALGQKCKEYKLYIAGSAYEKEDPEFPDKIFNTGFIIDPEGKVALKYRKMNTTNNGLELVTSPHDVWDRYSHDPKKLFPVLETPYGNFGMYICYDAHFPEVARCLALNGAEVLIRPNQWFFGTIQQLELMQMHNRMRAIENSAYLITTNWAVSPFSEEANSCGHAMIVDYSGRVLVERQDNVESFICAGIDVNALREYRSNPRYCRNFIMGLRTEVYAAVYGSKTCWPANLYLDRNMETLDEKWPLYKDIIARLRKEGTLR